MYCAMVDENEMQDAVTVAVAMENIGKGCDLIEKALKKIGKDGTWEEFNEAVGRSVSADTEPRARVELFPREPPGTTALPQGSPWVGFEGLKAVARSPPPWQRRTNVWREATSPARGGNATNKQPAAWRNFVRRQPGETPLGGFRQAPRRAMEGNELKAMTHRITDTQLQELKRLVVQSHHCTDDAHLKALSCFIVKLKEARQKIEQPSKLELAFMQGDLKHCVEQDTHAGGGAGGKTRIPASPAW
jgi:hypothetical protein